MSKPWPRVPLGELLRLERRPIKVVADGQYAEIGIYCFGRGIFHKSPRSGLEVGNKDLFLIKEGDFILQVTFAWEGAVGLASPAEDGMYGSTRFPTFRVDESRCSPPYLVQYFKTHEGREQLVKISPGSAGRNRVLSLKRIIEVFVPLPPLSEQKRIVARIEELAAKIEEAKGLRQKAVEEAEALNKSIRSSCLSDAQERYSCEVLGSLISMSSGEGLVSSQLSDSFEYPVYGGGGFVGYYSRYLFEEPKIAIGRVGARCGCVFVTEPKAWITDNALYLTKISDRLDERYLVYALSNADLRQEANQAAQPVVSQKKINPIVISLPPLSEQRRIVAYLDNLQAKVDSLKRLQAGTAAELNTMQPSVLDRAFKGEL